MPTGNETYFDAALRHQIGVQRFTTGEVNRLLPLIDRANAELVAKLRKQLGRVPLNRESERLRSLIRVTRNSRRDLIRNVQGDFTNNMRDFSKLEAQFETDLIKEGLPVELDLNRAAPQTLRALVTAQPFSGGADNARTMNQWFTGLLRSDQNGIVDAIRLGIVQGESVDDMVRRLTGTRARGFSNGVLGLKRRQAEAVIRTGVNHVSNQAREAVWDANSDIIEALQWVSTLDGRTTPICMARDGKFAPISNKPLSATLSKMALHPPLARPPAHPNCRSVMISVFDAEGVANQMGDRPMVRDMRTRRMREKDFRADTHAKLGDKKWKALSPKQRNAEIRRERNIWAKENVGTVPAKTTYQQWLKKQPVKFQDEVLGKAKGQLFRKGDVPLDKFVDKRGATMTLKQLAKTRPTAFQEAGIDPITLHVLD